MSVTGNGQTRVNGAAADGAAPTPAAPVDPLAAQNALVAQYRQALPTTPAQLQVSNSQIEAATYELGGIYKEQLKEKQRGYETYAGQVERYPRGEHAPDADYLLYLYYKDLPDPAKAAQYAAALQREFPTSTYAKLIADPQYREHERALHNAVAARLDSAFVLYKDQYFTKAKAVVAHLERQYPKSDLSDRVAYLKLLLAIRTQPPKAVRGAVAQFTKDYPDSPLVPQVQALASSFQRAEAGQLAGALASTDKPVVSQFRPGEVETRVRILDEVETPPAPAPTPPPPANAPAATGAPVPAADSAATPVAAPAATPAAAAAPKRGPNGRKLTAREQRAAAAKLAAAAATPAADSAAAPVATPVATPAAAAAAPTVAAVPNRGPNGRKLTAREQRAAAAKLAAAATPAASGQPDTAAAAPTPPAARNPAAPATAKPPATVVTQPAPAAATPAAPAVAYATELSAPHAVVLIYPKGAAPTPDLVAGLTTYNGKFFRASKLTVQPAQALGTGQEMIIVQALAGAKVAQSYATKLRGPQSPLARLRGQGYETVIISVANLARLQATGGDLAGYQQFYQKVYP